MTIAKLWMVPRLTWDGFPIPQPVLFGDGTPKSHDYAIPHLSSADIDTTFGNGQRSGAAVRLIAQQAQIKI